MGCSNWRYINAINTDSRLKAPDKALLHALVSFRNNATSQCNPSIDSLAERAGMDRRSVLRSLPILREWSFIAYTGKPNVRTQYDIYPLPSRFGDSDNLSPEPIRREANFSEWSEDTMERIVEVMGYKPDQDDFGSIGPLDHDEWDERLAAIHFEDIAERVGYDIQQFRDNTQSQPGDLDIVSF